LLRATHAKDGGVHILLQTERMTLIFDLVIYSPIIN
jgi:hypothetical protein